MECYRCKRKPIENNLSMIPIDTKGTKVRRWICIDCATEEEISSVNSEARDISKIFDKRFDV